MLNVSKGDTVILKGFTGIKLGVFEVEKATEKTVTVLKKDGSKMIFSRKTGKQTNVEEGKEKYANSIMEDDGSYVKPNRSKKTAKKSKKSQKSKKTVAPVIDEEVIEEEVVDEDEFDDDFEDDEEFEDTEEQFVARRQAKFLAYHKILLEYSSIID